MSRQIARLGLVALFTLAASSAVAGNPSDAVDEYVDQIEMLMPVQDLELSFGIASNGQGQAWVTPVLTDAQGGDVPVLPMVFCTDFAPQCDAHMDELHTYQPESVSLRGTFVGNPGKALLFVRDHGGALRLASFDDGNGIESLVVLEGGLTALLEL